MKEDVEIPERPPRKRRQMQQALDLWIAAWLARDDLTPSERRRCEAEKEERKRRRELAEVRVGFSGTRAGMTPQQRARIRELFAATRGIVEAHHGDCVGSDVGFHDEARKAHVDVVTHPPEDARLRAFCAGIRSEPALPFLERDKEIVKASTVLWATPKEASEPEPARGQGTWSTVRYARKRGVPVVVIMPDGSDG